MIPFNKPPYTGNEDQYIIDSINSAKISGDGQFAKRCYKWFKEKLQCETLLTTSCTHALEMAAILLDIQAGDEVIMPSYTFVSTANSLVYAGAKPIFVDIISETINLDPQAVTQA